MPKKQKRGGVLGLTQRTPKVETQDVSIEDRARETLEKAGYEVKKTVKPETHAETAERIEKDKAIRAAERLENPIYWWPKDRKLPEFYVKSGRGIDSAMPCPRCRRVRFDNLSVAVKLSHSGYDGGLAYFQCNNCGNRFSLPVKAAEKPVMLPSVVPISDKELAARRKAKADAKTKADAAKKAKQKAFNKSLLPKIPEAVVKEGAAVLDAARRLDRLEKHADPAKTEVDR